VDAKQKYRQSEMLAHLEKPWLAHHVMSSITWWQLGLISFNRTLFWLTDISPCPWSCGDCNNHTETPTHQIILQNCREISTTTILWWHDNESSPSQTVRPSTSSWIAAMSCHDYPLTLQLPNSRCRIVYNK
jgi:hypothetical protein